VIVSVQQELSGWNILLVDDDPSGLEVLEELITFYGATTHTAWNGQKALELVKEEKFDLILTDLSMPIMDGIELTRALKGDPSTVNIPVIILTAHSLDHQNAIASGCDALMTKPINPAKLLDQLKAVLPDHLGKTEDDAPPSNEAT
jgi:CheY-like chemotaxis protein